MILPIKGIETAIILLIGGQITTVIPKNVEMAVECGQRGCNRDNGVKDIGRYKCRKRHKGKKAKGGERFRERRKGRWSW